MGITRRDCDMKKTVWKEFMDVDKEEAWLNEMSAKGLAFTNYFRCRYSFTECSPGEYTYRIEILKHNFSHPESERYLKFMVENRVENRVSGLRKIYFRKRSEDGKFEIYNDIDSKIAHYKRIGLIYLCIEIIWLFLMCNWLVQITDSIMSGEPLSLYSIFWLGWSCVWGMIILYALNSYRKKIKKLKQEKKSVGIKKKVLTATPQK